MIVDDPTARPQSNKLEPGVAWTVLTEAPLKGLGLAREAGTVFAWDEAEQLYLLDLRGEHRSVARAPGKVNSAVVSDDGSRIALLGEGGRLWLLDGDLGVVAQRQAPPDPLALAIDPHGRYVLVTSRLGTSHFYNRFGKPAGRFETTQPLAFVAFVPAKPLLIGSAAYGMLGSYDLSGGASGRLSAEPDWVDKQVTGVGRLTTTGDGSMILASCFTHGIQRYDLHGRNDGAYHLGGTPNHAVPDYVGRTIAAATLEGELSLLNSAGNVRWKTKLPRPLVGLETDPLGRYLVYGHATGEVVRLDLYGGATDARPRPASTPGDRPGSARPSTGTVRRPDWSLPFATSDDQAESAVVGVLDEPTRVGLFPNTLRLQLVNPNGQSLGYAPEVAGVGRILRTSPGWLAAATDRQIALFHAPRGLAQRVDLSLVEVTHLEIRPDTFGLLVVQERDRVGRATTAGRWVWKQELKVAVEDVAIGPDGYSAVSTDDGGLTVYDPAGNPSGSFLVDPPEPLLLIDAVGEAAGAVAWMSLARRSQVLRGHSLRGRVVWETPVAFEGWMLLNLGRVAVVSAPDGRAVAFDGSGNLRGQGRNPGAATDLFGANARGEPRRVSHQGANLICTDLDGRVRWRAVCDEPIGPVAVGRSGVAAVIGRNLSWFPGLD